MKLAAYFTQHQINPREFAGKVGVSAESIRLYLTGERRPRARVIQAITAETAGAVTANDFFASEAAE